MSNSNGSKGYVVSVEIGGERRIFDYQLFHEPGNMVSLGDKDPRLKNAIVRYGLMLYGDGGVNGNVFKIVPLLDAYDGGRKVRVGKPAFRCRLDAKKQAVVEVKGLEGLVVLFREKLEDLVAWFR